MMLNLSALWGGVVHVPEPPSQALGPGITSNGPIALGLVPGVLALPCSTRVES